MRFPTTPAMVVKAARSLTRKIYSISQFKTLIGVSTYVTALAWESMLLQQDTVQKEVSSNFSYKYKQRATLDRRSDHNAVNTAINKIGGDDPLRKMMLVDYSR